MLCIHVQLFLFISFFFAALVCTLFESYMYDSLNKPAVSIHHWFLLQCHVLFYLQYQEGFSNWTILSISVTDEDDLPARFSTYEYNAVVREDACLVRFKKLCSSNAGITSWTTLVEVKPPNWDISILSTHLTKREFFRADGLPLEALSTPNMPAPHP